MSNIYIQEPLTSGKILLKTTVGDIDIELWARECPKACRNFIQLAMEGYYNNTIFHRVVKGFIVQGGDPNGDGTGGESIWNETFKDEFHSRLRYVRRGLLGMANADKDDNGSQFFFTMAPTPELQNKNTLFGKVTGDTVFNMLKLEEGMVDHNERPIHPHRIIKIEILNNPFSDIVPREIKKEKKKDKNKIQDRGVKNFGLLSFGEEAEEDEQETSTFNQKNVGKGKSTHDVLDDPRLSKEAVKIEKNTNVENFELSCENESDIKEKAERIKNKLKSKVTEKSIEKEKLQDSSDDDGVEDFLITADQEKKKMRDQKAKEIREEIVQLKKQYKNDKKKHENLIEQKTEKQEPKIIRNELLEEFKMEQDKYVHLKDKAPKKGFGREEFTLKLLSKFRNKLETLKDNATEVSESKDDEQVEKDIKNDNWLAHTLKFEENAPSLAKDASTKNDDWYDVYDPRNSINKRKRGEDKRNDSKKSKT